MPEDKNPNYVIEKKTFSWLSFILGFIVSYVVGYIIGAIAGTTSSPLVIAIIGIIGVYTIGIIALDYMLRHGDSSQKVYGKSFLIGFLGAIIGLIAERLINNSINKK